MMLLAAYSLWFDKLFPVARRITQEKTVTAEQLAPPETAPAKNEGEQEKKRDVACRSIKLGVGAIIKERNAFV